MAIVIYTKNRMSNSIVYTWTNMVDGDEGLPIQISERTYSTLTVSIFGDFGNGNVEIHGSSDGVNYQPMVIDVDKKTKIGSDLMTTIKSRPLYLKPCLVSGSSQDLTVTVTLKNIGS